jgi:ParB-like chromosome segregation protein Spo0J
MKSLPALSAAEHEELRESIRRDGVQYPVLLDRSGSIVDGHHRRAICTELGIECPTITLDLDDEVCDRLRIELNTARRQLPTKDRRMLVIELRAQGRSTRQIAEQAGVTQTTILKDLRSTEHPCSVETPATVVGNDGKVRAARSTQTEHRRQVQARKAADAERKAEAKRAQQSIAKTAAVWRANAITNAPDGKLNLPALRRARAIRANLIALAELIPPERFVSQLPVEALREMTPDVVSWWLTVATLATERFELEGAGVPALPKSQRPPAVLRA